VSDLLSLAREVLRLDAEATKGPWRAGSVEKFHVFVPAPKDSLSGRSRAPKGAGPGCGWCRTWH